MKLSKFLTIVIFITCLSLLYVYQQTEIFCLAYTGQKKEAQFQDSLDKNTILRYNIGNKASLVRIGSKVPVSADFQMPDGYRLVRVTPSGERARSIHGSANNETMLSRLFGIKRQAEAKTINP
ncbi:MAG: hypothetical protein WC723_05815 [Candidatus Omnitrophota bacterium]